MCNINEVMAAVGPQIFSYLPIGSLLNGRHSPMLANTIFHDNVYLCLGQSKTLSLSQNQNLRAINDEQLTALIRKIVEISEASNPEECSSTSNVVGAAAAERRRRTHDCSDVANCRCTMKVTHLDLSRCRSLTGSGIHYCLKHTPHVRRILLSSASRFDARESFADGNIVDALTLPRLEHLDLSCCGRVDSVALKNFMSVVLPHNIRHLDLAGASSMIDDDVFGTLALCQNLENLALNGARKIS